VDELLKNLVRVRVNEAKGGLNTKANDIADQIRDQLTSDTAEMIYATPDSIDGITGEESEITWDAKKEPGVIRIGNYKVTITVNKE